MRKYGMYVFFKNFKQIKEPTLIEDSRKGLKSAFYHEIPCRLHKNTKVNLPNMMITRRTEVSIATVKNMANRSSPIR